MTEETKQNLVQILEENEHFKQFSSFAGSLQISSTLQNQLLWASS